MQKLLISPFFEAIRVGRFGVLVNPILSKIYRSNLSHKLFLYKSMLKSPQRVILSYLINAKFRAWSNLSRKIYVSPWWALSIGMIVIFWLQILYIVADISLWHSTERAFTYMIMFWKRTYSIIISGWAFNIMIIFQSLLRYA